MVGATIRFTHGELDLHALRLRWPMPRYCVAHITHAHTHTHRGTHTHNVNMHLCMYACMYLCPESGVWAAHEVTKLVCYDCTVTQVCLSPR